MNNLIYTPAVQRQADNLMKSYYMSKPSASRADVVRVCIMAVRLAMQMDAEQNGCDVDNSHSYTTEFYKSMIQYLNAQL